MYLDCHWCEIICKSNMLLSSKNMPVTILKRVKYCTWFCYYLILNCLVLVELKDVVVEGSLEIAHLVFIKAKFKVKNFSHIDSRWISASKQKSV